MPTHPPTAASGPTGAFWTTEEVSEGYTSWTREYLDLTHEADRTKVLTSYAAGRSLDEHVLLVDLDQPSRLLLDGDGHQWLHTQVPVTTRAAARLRRRLVRHGTARDVTLPTRLHVDRANGHAARALATFEQFDGSFAQMMATAISVAHEVPHGETVTPDPGDGCWIPLAGHHLLIDSSTPGHHHLIGTVPMSWRQLKASLKALRKAGVIERGWEAMARGRRCATLRRPAASIPADA